MPRRRIAASIAAAVCAAVLGAIGSSAHAAPLPAAQAAQIQSVIKINGKPVTPVLWDDNVVIGPNGGSVTWRTHVTDFTGKFVMHCHILLHEGNGMMSAVQVVR